MAALQEIAGKERELATDPDCAGGLERMAYSMDDFVRRVFMDSLTGSYDCSHHPPFPLSDLHSTDMSCSSNIVSRLMSSKRYWPWLRTQ
jgi:hypothetical protein